MTPENFVYWLQGYMELTETTEIGPRETEMIKKHLDLVLIKSPLTIPKEYKLDPKDVLSRISSGPVVLKC